MSTDDTRIDHPETADDYLLAAAAWMDGRRSLTNTIMTAVPDPDQRHAVLAAIEQADAARAAGFAAIGAALALVERMLAVTEARR